MPDVDHRAVLESLSDAVVAADVEGRIVYLNPAAEALLGWPQDALVGRPLTTIQPPRLRDAHLRGFRRYVAGGAPRLLGDPLRVAALRRDGSEVDVDLILGAQRRPDGTPLLVGSLHEAGERVELERRVATTGYVEAATRLATQLSGPELRHLAESVVAALVRDFDAAVAEVWLQDAPGAEAGGRLRLAARGGPAMAGGRAAAAIGEVARTGRALSARDLAHAPEALARAWPRGAGVATAALLPLVVRGVVHGVLVLGSRRQLPEQVLDVLAGVVASLVAEARLLGSERSARADAERALRRSTFLVDASRELASSLDIDTTLASVARLAVPGMADWCVVDLVTEDGSLRRVVAAHCDPEKEALAFEVGRRYPPGARSLSAAARVAATGRTEMTAHIPDELLAAAAADDEHLRLLRRLGLTSSVSVPLRARGRTLGVLTCAAADPDRRFDDDDRTTLEGLARQAALAVDNARLFEDLGAADRAKKESLALLDALFAAAPVGLGFFDSALRYVRVNPTLAAMNGCPPERILGRTPSQIHGTPGEAPERHLREVAATGRAIVDVELSYASPAEPGLERHWSTSYYPVPSQRGEPVGVGMIVAEVTGRRRAEQALQRERAFLKAVLENLTDGIVACDPHGALTIFNAAAEQLHGLDARSLPAQRWAERYDLYQPDGETPMEPLEVPLARALAGEEVRNVEMVIAPRGGDRRMVLCNGEALHDDDGRKLGAVVALHDVTDRKQAEARLTRQALQDPLTALPNRLLLLDRLRQALARARRRPGTVAALFLDLDRFKVINDSLGHDVGDEALIEIARRLEAVVRPSDTVARLGGDEFVVLCEGIESAQEAVRLSERVEAAVTAPCRLRARERTIEVVLTTSVGIAVANGDERPEDLLRNADAAMYRAKQRGKARHEVFDDTVRATALTRLHVENALRRALEHERLRLLYQPIVDLRDGTLAGVEALVRYEDPEHGLIPPADFLEVAEDSGLIVHIGSWVLTEACRQAARWRKLAGRESLQVSVNLSARQLAGSNLIETLEQVQVCGGLPPGALSLEITESVLMEAASSTLRMLDRVKKAGPRLGIDDFGTGYSSLTYLRRFPVDFLKIDRSFVAGLGSDAEDSAIVTAVVGLGKALGLTTIAEGVETEGQLEALRDLGCDLAQGYYFARPQPGGAITQLLASDRRW